MATQRREVRLRRPLSPALLHLIRTRFDSVSSPEAGGAVLLVEGLDQAALRALLTLLWDAGHEVLSLTLQPPTET